MRRITYFVCVILILSLHSCSKTPGTAPPPQPPTDTIPIPPTTQPGGNFVIDGKWQCEIDGKFYSGTVDTSFMWISNPTRSHPDTVVECTGTALDKKANIHFKIFINRKSAQPVSIVTSSGLLLFDTISTKFMVANWHTREQITYRVDTFMSNKMKATFSGTVTVLNQSGVIGQTTHHVTNGKFSCELGKGTSEPKTFTFNNDGAPVSGYFCSAKLVSNSLILEGAPYSHNGEQQVKLTIRTGGTIKTGTYENSSGGAGFHYYTPSIYPVYVNDSMGDLSVTISSVNGNIIEGSFSGADEYGPKITSGSFRCRVKDYVPQIDSMNKWAFSHDGHLFLFNAYGGNILNATRSQAGSKYFLTVNGESDHGTSRFKIILSSPSPITKGVYQTNHHLNAVDSLTFASNTKIWNGNSTYMYADDHGGTYCTIDSIDSKNVYGTLSGLIRIHTNSGSYFGTEIRKGRFRASF